MKNILLIPCLCSALTLLHHQMPAQYSYYYGNTEIELTEQRLSQIFFFDSIVATDSLSQLDTIVNSIEYLADSLEFIIHFNTEPSQTGASLLLRLNIDTTGLNGTGYGLTHSGQMIYPSNRLIMKLESGYTLQDIDSLLVTNGLIYEETSYGLIYLLTQDPMNGLVKANILRNDSRIQWCHTDFFVTPVFASDPLYTYQYYLKNNGQTGGTIDADIDANEAWTISKGNGTIRIAVIDQGVAIHEDLNEDLSGNTKLLLPGWGWDGLGGTPQNSSERHGQNISGIIGAEHNLINNIGLRGVCPNSKILPVRVPLGTNLLSYFTAGINWAWAVGYADVINCSWNMSLQFPAIEYAITQALSSGRAGLGCPVIFSAGNNPGYVFPADVPGVIAVSALDKFGNTTTYSNTGTHISVAAFGGILSGSVADIYTTTLMGIGTVNTGTGMNYIDNFCCTSAAAAQVSGTVALLLSVEPNLTAAQVKCRIEQSATDIGAFGFDNNTGFGRLDAYYCIAIDDMQLIDESISGLQNYSAHNHIHSGNGCKINNNAVVNLIAGKSITLFPGFQTTNGAVFSASINNVGSCGTLNGGPFRFFDNSNIVLEEEEPIDISKAISLFPNPAGNYINVNSTAHQVKIIEIEIITSNGLRIITSKNLNHQALTIQTVNLPPGLYFTRIFTSQGIVINKFIIQR